MELMGQHTTPFGLRFQHARANALACQHASGLAIASPSLVSTPPIGFASAGLSVRAGGSGEDTARLSCAQCARPRPERQKTESEGLLTGGPKRADKGCRRPMRAESGSLKGWSVLTSWRP